jgi:hypothetical protein
MSAPPASVSSRHRPVSLSVAASGDPWRGSTRATRLRRVAVQVLVRDGWALATLRDIALRLLADVAPEYARGALDMVRRVLDEDKPDETRLRLQLIGAIALPGWREETLEAVAVRLANGAADIVGAEFADLLDAVAGARS